LTYLLEKSYSFDFKNTLDLAWEDVDPSYRSI